MLSPDADAEQLIGHVNHLIEEDQQQAALSLLEHVFQQWYHVLHETSASEALRLLTTLAQQLQQPHRALQYLSQALDTCEARPALEAELLLSRGKVYAGIGETERALADYIAARELYRTRRDSAGEGAALFAAGKAHQAAGDLRTAVPLFRDAFALLRGTTGWTDETAQMEQMIDAFSLADAVLCVPQARRAATSADFIATLHDRAASGSPAATRLMDAVSSMLEHLSNAFDPRVSGRLNHSLAALAHVDADRRAVGAREFAAYQPQEAVVPLWDALASETDPVVQTALIQALRAYRDPAFTERLRPYLTHDVPDVRLAAALALAELGDAGVEPYLEAGLNSSDDVPRAEAVQALAQIGTSWSAGQLRPLLHDRNPKVRAKAVQALGKVRDQHAVPEIIAATRDRYQVVRWAAVRVLGDLRPPEAVDTLISALNDTNRDVRRSAATALGRLKDPRAIEPLTVALFDEWNQVAESARAALRKLKAKPSPTALLAQLHNDRASTRRAAVALIEEYLGTDAIVPLRPLLDDSDPTVRVSAIGALARLGDRESVPAMLAELHQTNPMLQINVIEALGALGDERAAPDLMALLKNPNPYVRFASVKALANVGTIDSLPALAMLQIQDEGMVSLGNGLQVQSLKTAAAATMHRIRARYRLMG